MVGSSCTNKNGRRGADDYDYCNNDDCREDGHGYVSYCTNTTVTTTRRSVTSKSSVTETDITITTTTTKTLPKRRRQMGHFQDDDYATLLMT